MRLLRRFSRVDCAGIWRGCSSLEAQPTVRTRFAPSPTGDMHLGGLRSALYNYMFARQHGGQFLLRIEDTDQTRVVNGSVDRLGSLLTQMGLVSDEGPWMGGPCGPYSQSERLDVYRGVIEQLLESGHAYRCFCNKQRLELVRKSARKRGENPRYDNRCRHLSSEKLQMFMDKKLRYVIRFKLEGTDRPFTDLVYGDLTIDSARQEGDPVLLKSDGYPTYHMASVVDDHLMHITHVLRGFEWQISTPKHIALYRALEWKPPQYAHLPLLCNSDGTKLSKRQGDATVLQLLERGFTAEALLNYVCLTGGGFGNLEHDRLTTLPELVERFDVTRLNGHLCRLSPEKLDRLNLQALRRRYRPLSPPSGDQGDIYSPPSEGSGQQLRDQLRLKVADHLSEHNTDGTDVLTDIFLDRVLQYVLNNGRISCIDDLVDVNFSYLWLPPQSDLLLTQFAEEPRAADVLRDVLDGVTSLPHPCDDMKDPLVALFRRISSDRDVTFSRLMLLLRLSVSGAQRGPGVAEMIEVLGREESLRRISHSLDALNLAKKSPLQSETGQ